MGKNGYLGVNSVSKKIKNIYIGDSSGVAKKVKKGCVGVGSVAKEWFGNVDIAQLLYYKSSQWYYSNNHLSSSTQLGTSDIYFTCQQTSSGQPFWYTIKSNTIYRSQLPDVTQETCVTIPKPSNRSMSLEGVGQAERILLFFDHNTYSTGEVSSSYMAIYDAYTNKISDAKYFATIYTKDSTARVSAIHNANGTYYFCSPFRTGTQVYIVKFTVSSSMAFTPTVQQVPAYEYNVTPYWVVNKVHNLAVLSGHINSSTGDYRVDCIINMTSTSSPYVTPPSTNLYSSFFKDDNKYYLVVFSSASSSGYNIAYTSTTGTGSWTKTDYKSQTRASTSAPCKGFYFDGEYYFGSGGGKTYRSKTFGSAWTAVGTSLSSLRYADVNKLYA